jgi:2-isopropylmalate synthase
MLSNRETYEIMTPESVGFRQSEMVLGKHSGRHAFEEKLKEMGYIHLDAEEINEAFSKFKDLADKKKFVTDRDIEALLSEKVIEVPAIYELEYFHISSGNSTIATSTVRLKKDDMLIQEAACGDGPIDATFKAIERAAGLKINLKDFYLRAVTSGTDALGEVTVKIGRNGDIYVGRGISTDVIEASAKGYVNAINKMLYETEME